MINTQIFFSPFPVIDLGNIILRKIQVGDAKEYLDYMNNELMAGFFTEDNRPQTLGAAAKEMIYWGGLFDSKQSLYWAITLREDNRMIGTVGFNTISFSHSRAEISYDLNPKYWGTGVMLHSIEGVLRFSDRELQIIRTQATVIVTNIRSIKVLERCGFKQEGCLKKYELVEGDFKDYYIYARIK